MNCIAKLKRFPAWGLLETRSASLGALSQAASRKTRQAASGPPMGNRVSFAMQFIPAISM